MTLTIVSAEGEGVAPIRSWRRCLTSGLNDQNRYVASKATADANRNSRILFVNRGRATRTFYHQIRAIDEEKLCVLCVLRR